MNLPATVHNEIPTLGALGAYRDVWMNGFLCNVLFYSNITDIHILNPWFIGVLKGVFIGVSCIAMLLTGSVLVFLCAQSCTHLYTHLAPITEILAF